MTRARRLLSVSAVCVLLLSACGSDDTPVAEPDAPSAPATDPTGGNDDADTRTPEPDTGNTEPDTPDVPTTETPDITGDAPAVEPDSPITGDAGTTPPAIPNITELRDEAVEQIVAEGIERATAECIVDALIDEWPEFDFLAAVDDPNYEYTPANDDDMTRLFSMLIDCGVSFDELLGDDITFDGGLLPGHTYGDNAELDALWDACGLGDGEACDELYFTSQFGSDYEHFGDTCGERYDPGTVMCAIELDD